MLQRLALVLTTASAAAFATPASALADTVIIPSEHVEAGPVSADTPAVTRTHEDEDLLTSAARCLADPQISPTSVGCPG
jgi:hypothetical protein